MAVPMFTLTGRLVDVSNKRLPGIRIMVYTRPSAQFATDGDQQVAIRSSATTTDKQGNFSFSLIAKPGLHYRIAPEHSAAFDPITFAAPPGGTTLDLSELVPSTPSPIPPTDAIQLQSQIDDKADNDVSASGLGATYLATVSDLINGEPVSVMKAIPSSKHSAIYDGSSTDDVTSYAQDILSHMPGYGTIVYPRGKFTQGNLQIANKTDFKLLGNGARIVLTGDGTALGVNGIGIELVGTLAGVEIAGFHIVGDGNKLHLHQGVWNSSGQTISDLRVHHNIIEQVRVGISVNANTAGTIDGFSITDNVVKDLVGIASGQGYGIHCAYLNAGPARGQIARNRVYRAGRHSIYVARVADVDVFDNFVYGHRSAITAPEIADAADGRGKTRAALNCARSHNIRIWGNTFIDGYDGAVTLVPNPEGAVGVVLYDVSVRDNHFRRPQNSVPMVIIGDPNPAVAGTPIDVVVDGNDFYSDYSSLSGVNSVDAIRMNNGKNVKIKNNKIVIRGVNQTTAGISVYAQLDGSASNTYTDDLEIEGNTAHLDTSVGSTCRGISLDTTAATSIAKISLLRNEATGSATNAPTYTPGYTNPNLRLQTRTGDVYAVNVDGDTTPSVGRGVTVLDITNSATTLITGFDDAEEGQRITLKFNDQNSRLVFGNNMRVAGGVNYTSNNRQTVTLVLRSGVWYEVARLAPLPLPVTAWVASTVFAQQNLVRLPTGGLAYSINGTTSTATFDATERTRWTFTPGGHADFLSSGTTSWICPTGITEATFNLMGGGGGGAGGGSASAVSTQVGGGGGACGEVSRVTVAVVPGTTYTVAIGAGGTAGAGAVAGGAAGGAGGSGGDTTIVIAGTTYIARGGTAGIAGGANSTTTVGGGVPGRNAGLNTTTAAIPGCGGVATSTSGTGCTPLEGIIGGGAGAPTTSTSIGGLGGTARTSVGGRVDSQGTGGTGTTAGGTGTVPTQPGCGGAGGGGGAVGGAGGAGSAGAAGQIVINF